MLLPEISVTSPVLTQYSVATSNGTNKILEKFVLYIFLYRENFKRQTIRKKAHIKDSTKPEKIKERVVERV